MVATFQENIIATGVSFDEYMEKYAADFCEWIDGVVIKMSPVTDTHDIITRLLSNLLEAYLELRPIAVLREDPFVLKLSDTISREPDLQVVLNEHAERIQKTKILGKADIVIEVVLLESTDRDYGRKFTEYEAAGVPEYWIIDPLRQETRFFRLTNEGFYASQPLNENDEYETPMLPGLRLPTDWLWQTTPPGPIAIGEKMKEWLAV